MGAFRQVASSPSPSLAAAGVKTSRFWGVPIELLES